MTESRTWHQTPILNVVSSELSDQEFDAFVRSQTNLLAVLNGIVNCIVIPCRSSLPIAATHTDTLCPPTTLDLTRDELVVLCRHQDLFRTFGEKLYYSRAYGNAHIFEPMKAVVVLVKANFTETEQAAIRKILGGYFNSDVYIRKHMLADDVDTLEFFSEPTDNVFQCGFCTTGVYGK